MRKNGDAEDRAHAQASSTAQPPARNLRVNNNPFPLLIFVRSSHAYTQLYNCYVIEYIQRQAPSVQGLDPPHHSTP
jgi:hypothetical protein